MPFEVISFDARSPVSASPAYERHVAHLPQNHGDEAALLRIPLCRAADSPTGSVKHFNIHLFNAWMESARSRVED